MRTEEPDSVPELLRAFQRVALDIESHCIKSHGVRRGRRPVNAIECVFNALRFSRNARLSAEFFEGGYREASVSIDPQLVAAIGHGETVSEKTRSKLRTEAAVVVARLCPWNEPGKSTVEIYSQGLVLPAMGLTKADVAQAALGLDELITGPISPSVERTLQLGRLRGRVGIKLPEKYRFLTTAGLSDGDAISLSRDAKVWYRFDSSGNEVGKMFFQL